MVDVGVRVEVGVVVVVVGGGGLGSSLLPTKLCRTRSDVQSPPYFWVFVLLSACNGRLY